MNTQELIQDLFESMKSWVQSGFDDLGEQIKRRDARLKADFEQKIGEIHGKTPEKAALLEYVLRELPAIDPQEEIAKYFKSDSAKALLAPLIEERQSQLEKTVTETLDNIPIPKDGKDGADGKDGESVDHEELQKMVDSAVEKAVQAIPTPKDGKDGEPGKDGADGKSLTLEEVLPSIREEIVKQFSAIELPKDGKDGEPGKDGLEIDILPAIDPEKSYPRATYASHKGGLWRSFRTTEGMDGWECIVRGEAGIEIEQIDERHFDVVRVDSTGKEKVSRFSLPTMVYRGIWKEVEHHKGDTVTWGGSLWHCNYPTTDKPGTSDAWTLCAKKGRDGK